jgi:ELWxxDGT repeat protein
MLFSNLTHSWRMGEGEVRRWLPLLAVLCVAAAWLLPPPARADQSPRPVLDLNPSPLGSFPSHLTDVRGTLYFSADDGVHGKELWKSDGTAAGTVLVADIRPGPGSPYPERLTDVGDTLYFEADDGTHGDELWKSDGSPEGTVLVKDIRHGSQSSEPSPRSRTVEE